MGENLNLMQALYVTISSMAMVFLILLVISGVLSLFKYIFRNENNTKNLILTTHVKTLLITIQ